MILVYLILFLLITFHSDKSFMISVRNSIMMHKSRISASKINEVAYSYEQNNNNINNNNNNNNNKIKNNLLNLLINDLLISSKNAKLSIDMLKLNISNGDSIEDTSYQNNDNNNYSKLSWNDSKSFLLTLLLFQKIQLIHSSENNNKNNNDPFSKMKMNELFNTLVFIEDLALIIPDTIELEKEQLLENCLYLSLLTSSPSEYIPVSKQNAFNSDNNNLTLKKKKMMFYNFISEIKNKKNNVILDDVTKISNFLNSLADNSNSNSNNNDKNNDNSDNNNNNSKNIHIGICPGSIGKELISDLFLTYSLISSGICSTCTIFTSSYSLGSKLTPTTSDILAHVSFLSDPSSSDSWGVRHLGAAIQTLIINGNIIIHEDLVWTRPTNFHWEMENNDNNDNNNINNNNNNDFKEIIKSCDLLIMKGELNYCRLEKYDGHVLVNDNIVVVEPSPYVSICSVRFNNNNENSRVTSAIEFIKKS